jgi:hypothetical protein
MTPEHLIPIEPAESVRELCDALALEIPTRHSVTWLELVAFRDTRTPHDGRRLAFALRHVLKREDLARKVEALTGPPPGVLADLYRGERSE